MSRLTLSALLAVLCLLAALTVLAILTLLAALTLLPLCALLALLRLLAVLPVRLLAIRLALSLPGLCVSHALIERLHATHEVACAIERL